MVTKTNGSGTDGLYLTDVRLRQELLKDYGPDGIDERVQRFVAARESEDQGTIIDLNSTDGSGKKYWFCDRQTTTATQMASETMQREAVGKDSGHVRNLS